jgi:hypothetical protein
MGVGVGETRNDGAAAEIDPRRAGRAIREQIRRASRPGDSSVPDGEGLNDRPRDIHRVYRSVVEYRFHRGSLLSGMSRPRRIRTGERRGRRKKKRGPCGRADDRYAPPSRHDTMMGERAAIGKPFQR